jgi:hypothetical protein
MSADAPNWFVEQYNSNVAHKYQSRGFLLRGTVMPEGRITGTKAYFPISGKGTARKKVRGQEAVPMNPSRGFTEADLVTWEAFDEVYSYDLSRLTVNERDALAFSGSNALGRATDAEIIDLFDDNIPDTVGAQMIGDGTDDLDLDAVMAMCQLGQAQEWPWDGNAFMPMPSLLWGQFISYKQVSNADYTGPDLPFVKATSAKTFNGVNFFLAPDSLFPVPAANKVDLFLYHRTGWGWANNSDVQSIWDWDNRKGCWTVRMECEGAAAPIVVEGGIRGRFKSNGSISTTERVISETP